MYFLVLVVFKPSQHQLTFFFFILCQNIQHRKVWIFTIQNFNITYNIMACIKILLVVVFKKKKQNKKKKNIQFKH